MSGYFGYLTGYAGLSVEFFFVGANPLDLSDPNWDGSRPDDLSSPFHTDCET